MKKKQKIFLHHLNDKVYMDVSSNGNNNDMSCVCYIYENVLQTGIDETGLDNGVLTYDIKFRKECGAKS